MTTASPRIAPTTVLRLAGTIACTTVVSAALVLVAGADPVATLQALIDGSLGHAYGTGQTIMLASVLALVALAAAIPARARLWNVGGEGQMYAGALAAVAVALKLDAGPALVTVAALAAGMVAGGLVGLVAAWLKIVADANEVLTTLMLNFVVILFADYAITHAFPSEGIAGSTPEVPAGVGLPTIWATADVDVGVIAALGSIVVAHVLLSRGTLGLKIRAAGSNPDAARQCGVPVGVVFAWSLGLGGAFAGLAGAIVVIGIDGLLAANFSPGYGFIGIAVALLAQARPLWIAPAALLFAVLTVGGSYLEPTVGLSSSAALAIQAIIVLTLLAFWVLPTPASGKARA